MRWTAERRAAVRVALAIALAAVTGCATPDDAVLRTWDEYHAATLRGDVAAVRSLVAAGRVAELSDPDAAAALQMRAALVPAAPEVTGIEVSALRATLTVRGDLDGQPMHGRISFTKEADAWKLVEEEWSAQIDIPHAAGSFPEPEVDLAEVLSSGSAAPPQAVGAISAHDGTVTALAFTRDGRCLVTIGYDDRRLRLWDAATGALLTDAPQDDRPNDLALLPDGSAALVVDTGGHVTEWPIASGAFGPPRVLAGLTGATPRIAVDAAGRRAVTTSWDDPAKLWDLEAGTYVRSLPESDRMRGVAFSPAGPQVACGSHGDSFTVWNLDRLAWPVGSRRTLHVPNVSAESDVHSVAFSPDGRRLATGHMDSSLSIWNMETGRRMYDWYVQDCSVMDVTFSPCGTVLATAQQDGRVYLWETETRRTLARLPAHAGAATAVAFDPADGITLATGGEDGQVRIWR